MATFAVIKTGGKQYRVQSGDKLKVEKLPGEAGAVLKFEEVLLTADGDDVKVGTPMVSGATVEAKVIRQARDRKKIIFKYHSKTRYHKKRGHRQEFTEVQITKV